MLTPDSYGGVMKAAGQPAHMLLPCSNTETQVSFNSQTTECQPVRTASEVAAINGCHKSQSHNKKRTKGYCTRSGCPCS